MAQRLLVERYHAFVARRARRLLFAELKAADSHRAWVELRNAFADNVFAFSKRLGQVFEADELVQVLGLLLIPLAENAFKDWDLQRRFHRVSEKMGYHLLAAHFYSPIPTLAELDGRDWSQPISDSPSMNDEAQLDLLRRIAPWSHELALTPADRDVDQEHQYFWNNPSFAPTDAAVYYGLIREFMPRRIIEVGGGMSTSIAAQAAQHNWPAVMTRVTCLDPFPTATLAAGFPGLENLITEHVQAVPLELFDELRENDMLFIDSTHVAKAGSDVNHLFFKVLPGLHPGVIVHFHDIFLPWDYPAEWVTEQRIFWNEQYLLLAFLSCNASYEIMLGTHYITRKHPEDVRQLFPQLPSVGGGSFWMRRV